MIDDDTRESLTRDWLNLFEKDKASGVDLANSVFWRLALHSLPLGVDKDDPLVQAAVEEIKKAVEAKNG